MGRKKKEEIEKKVKIGVSVDPELPQYFKDKSINLSSLVNKLLNVTSINMFLKFYNRILSVGFIKFLWICSRRSLS